jgi:tRNA/rRNA methyltransferase
MEGATSMLLRRQLRIVLHQIQSAENLGAVARLMANFDFPVLRLSDAQLEDTGAANRTAVHAAHVLASAERAARLEDAVAEAVYVLGTSGRDALRGRTPVSPEEGVERLRAAAARGPVALVLGGERRGLSDEELALCQDVACIPAPGAQPSLNVAQAAAVLLYLASRADEVPSPAVTPDPGAPQALREVLRRRMERALRAADGLNPQSPLPVLDEMLRALDRARLSQREAELWAAAWKQMARVAGAPGD